MRSLRRLAVLAALPGLLSAGPAFAKEPFTIAAIVEQPQFRSIDAASSGRWITLLWTRADIASNTILARLMLQRAAAGAPAETLSEVSVDPGKALGGDGSLNPFGAESLWSPVHDYVAFTRRAAQDIELIILRPETGTFEKVAAAPRLKIVRWAADATELFYTRGDDIADSSDTGMRVVDGDNFHAPRWFSDGEPSVEWRTQRYVLAAGRSDEFADATVPADDSKQASARIEERLRPAANDRLRIVTVKDSPSGKQLAFLGHAFRNIGDESKSTREYFIGVAAASGDDPRILIRSAHHPVLLGWSADRRSILASMRDAQATTIAAIDPSSGAVRTVSRLEGVTYPEALNADRTRLFTVQHPLFAPDRVVQIDLQSGKQVELAAASPQFGGKELPKTRVINVSDAVGGRQWGVLVYPNGYEPGRRYPLVFTTYRAYTINLFAGSVGGEFPILPWAVHGIAVFCLDTGTANMPGAEGDMVSNGVWRVQRPVDAMRWIIAQLSAEGIVDPEHVGITGLSYGSEIVDYALAHSDLFRAAAAGGAGFSDPMSRWLLPLTRDREWDERGRVEPDPASWAAWAMISPSLNVRTARTPLLNNTAASEALFSAMLWKTYRSAGVPIEWYVYPNEGHVKAYPRNIAETMRRNLDWMRFWLKGEEDPVPEKAGQYARWRSLRELRDERVARPSGATTPDITAITEEVSR